MEQEERYRHSYDSKLYGQYDAKHMKVCPPSYIIHNVCTLTGFHMNPEVLDGLVEVNNSILTPLPFTLL